MSTISWLSEHIALDMDSLNEIVWLTHIQQGGWGGRRGILRLSAAVIFFLDTGSNAL